MAKLLSAWPPSQEDPGNGSVMGENGGGLESNRLSAPQRLGFAQMSPKWKPNARPANCHRDNERLRNKTRHKTGGTGMIYPEEGKAQQQALGAVMTHWENPIVLIAKHSRLSPALPVHSVSYLNSNLMKGHFTMRKTNFSKFRLVF